MKEPRKRTVRLIVWNAEEAGQKAAVLEKAGYEVVRSLPPGPALFKELRRSPPDAVVIDLGRLPSQGRDVGVTIRRSAATLHTPLVFIEGDPVKTEKVRALLPDACFTAWRAVRGALKKAVASPPSNPKRPDSSFAAYAGTPLYRKLGISTDDAVAVVGAPHGFLQALGELPQGASVADMGCADLDGRHRLCIWFPRSLAEMRRNIGRMKDAVKTLCVAWPKKASGVTSDLSQAAVRSVGLSADWVDYKILSMDSIRSALLFARRGRKR